MRLIYFYQFFTGPNAPGPGQPRALVDQLASSGHQVDVIACDFNAYNEQSEEPEECEYPSGGYFRVHRLATPRNLRASLRNRLRTYLAFSWRAWQFSRGLPKPDVVLGTIQPLFSGYAAMRRARIWGVPFVLEVRDLWPDALVAKNAIAPWQATPLQRLASSLYFGADRVITLTPGIRRELLEKGVPEDGLDLFPNAYDDAGSGQINRLALREAARNKYGWRDEFVAVYVGSFTEVTAVDVLVRAASALRDRADIRFDLFGSGQTRAATIALAREMGLENVHFHEAVPKSEVCQILAAADVGLMALFRSPLIHIYFENKLIDYMGAGLPIAAAMGGIQPELIAREGAGLVVDSFDHTGLAKNIGYLADHRDEALRMGQAGYRFISTKLARSEVLGRYCELLQDAANRNLHALPAWDPLKLC